MGNTGSGMKTGGSRGGQGTVWRAALLLVLGGMVVGLAGEYHWLGWSSIPGNSCGGSYPPCPQGTTPTILLAFLFTFTGIPLTGFLATRLSERRSGKALPAVLVAAGVVLALWPGWRAYAWMRGPVLDIVWDAPADRPAGVEGVGNWVLKDMAVRARTDGLVAYDIGSGHDRWWLEAPTRKSACAMSSTAPDGIGLIAFGRYGKPCDTVWAVDLTTGRKRWERRITGSIRFTSAGDGRLAAEGGVAVVLEDEAVRGFDLKDGTPRWKVPVGKDCFPDVVSAAGGHTRVLVQCFDRPDLRSLELVSLDNATGKQDWRRKLSAESEVNATVISADPFTLWLEEEDKRGINAVLTYDDKGRETSSLRISGPAEDLAFSAGGGFAARPVPRAALIGDTLVTAVQRPDESWAQGVSGYSLSDGRRLWHTDLDAPVSAVAAFDKGRVAVLTGDDRVWKLAAGTGAKDDGALVRGVRGRISDAPEVVPVHGGWLFFNARSDAATPPVLAAR
jgi:outer membrane protein assembly factor BamB